MVAYLSCGDARFFCPQPQRTLWLGVPVLWARLPPGASEARLARIGRRLRRLGARRCIPCRELAGDTPERLGLPGVDPVPLCRAKGAELALALLGETPPRLRRAALRGGDAREGYALARRLCPRVGTLLLDFDRGTEALAQALRAECGAACVPLGRGDPPQVTVELSPREDSAGQVLRLWGEPALAGLELAAERPLPPQAPALPTLELLWETGRLSTDEVAVRRREAREVE